MAADMMNVEDWIDEHNNNKEMDNDELTLEQELYYERLKLRSEEWNNAELFYTDLHCDIYHEPKESKKNLYKRLEPNTIILVAKLSKMTYRHGFRECLLPLRGWIYIGQDEYDRAFKLAAEMDMKHDFQEASRAVSGSVISKMKNKFTKHRTKSSRSLHLHAPKNGLHSNNGVSNGDLNTYDIDAHHMAGSHEIITPNMFESSPNIHSGNFDIDREIEESVSRHIEESRSRRRTHFVSYAEAQLKQITKAKDEINSDDNKEDGKVDTTLTEKEKESPLTKILNSKIVKKTIFYVRSNPSLLSLIYIIFTGIVEGVIFFDLVTDIIVLSDLAKANAVFLFGLSGVLIFAPYFIAWTSIFVLFDKKKEIWNRKKKYFKGKILPALFALSPIGVLVLIAFDVWTVIEFIVIRPIFFLFRCKLIRTDSFEELGYRKLRRVSEVCSETIFQAILQLVLFIIIRRAEKNAVESGIDDIELSSFTVGISLALSIIVIILWFGIILKIESSANGMNLPEYLPIVLQGSFKFVPFLPAIERGTKNGEKVNWCFFKYDIDSISALSKALGSPKCKLETIKITRKTLKRLPRLAVKHMANLLKHPQHQKGRIEVIISHTSKEIEDPFKLFDPNNSNKFAFIDFCKALLVLISEDNEYLSYDELSEVYRSLSNNDQKNVYLLDLLLKLRISKERIKPIDIDNDRVIDYAVSKYDVNLVTFCMHYGLKTRNSKNNIINTLIHNKLHIVHALTENIGVPIVVEITEGINLLNALDTINSIINHDIYINVKCCNFEVQTTSVNEYENAFWNEKILFIIPFSEIERILDDPGASLHRDTEHAERVPSTILDMDVMTEDFLDDEEVLDGYDGTSPRTVDSNSDVRKEDHARHISYNYSKSTTNTINIKTLGHVRTQHSTVPIYISPTIRQQISFDGTQNITSLQEENFKDLGPQLKYTISERNVIQNAEALQESDNQTKTIKKVNFKNLLQHNKTKSLIENDEMKNNAVSILQETQNKISESVELNNNKSKKNSKNYRRKISGRDSLLNDPNVLSKIGSFGKNALIEMDFKQKIFFDFTLYDDEDLKYDNINDHPLTPRDNILKGINLRNFDDNVGFNLNKKKTHSSEHNNKKREVKTEAKDRESTFLGSCHLSITLDDVEKLKNYHLTTITKEIKISKKRRKNIRDISNEQNGREHGKLKFKIYCAALAAYIKYGKNFGDLLDDESKNELILKANENNNNHHRHHGTTEIIGTQK